MALLTTSEGVQVGDIVVDTYYRPNKRKADGVRAHFGIVTRLENNQVHVAHVGEENFRIEAWNIPKSTPTIVLIARPPWTADEAAVLVPLLLNRVDELAALVRVGEQNRIDWDAVELGFTLKEEPFELMTTCIGFVHYCLSLIGFDLVDRDTIPQSRMHLSTCRGAHRDQDWHSLGQSVRRYFPGFGIRAFMAKSIPVSIPAPQAVSAESPWFNYLGCGFDEQIEALPCLESHLETLP